MPTEVIMPQMGESIVEGTITKWLKKPGEAVAKDEPLFEISTDKVDAEIPAPVSGTLLEIVAAEGETVAINVVVARIGVSGAAPVALAAPAAAVKSAPAPVVAPKPEAVPEPVGRRLRSSPLVRRIARENQLDLRQVPGTGSQQRITKEDILRYLKDNGPGGAVAAPAEPLPHVPGELVPMTKMRSIIAQRLLESKQTAPHAHNVYKVDMTHIVRIRQRERASPPIQIPSCTRDLISLATS